MAILIEVAPASAVSVSSDQVTALSLPWISSDPLCNEKPLLPTVGNYLSLGTPCIVILTDFVIGAYCVPITTLPPLTITF